MSQKNDKDTTFGQVFGLIYVFLCAYPIGGGIMLSGLFFVWCLFEIPYCILTGQEWPVFSVAIPNGYSFGFIGMQIVGILYVIVLASKGFQLDEKDGDEKPEPKESSTPFGRWLEQNDFGRYAWVTFLALACFALYGASVFWLLHRYGFLKAE
jgi:hypothetical protein